MTDNAPGWAVEITGDRLDVTELQHNLRQPFDPWTEEYTAGDGSKFILLRSASWTHLKEASEVVSDARRLVERMNGMALVIYSDSRPVSVGTPMKFGPNGKREHILFAASGSITLTGGRARGRVSVANKPEAPQESAMQRWMRDAEAEDLKAELFIHLSRADNWFDLYKSMELLRAIDSTRLTDALVGNRSTWDDARQTANHYRHAPTGKFPPPKHPPTFEEARALVLGVVGRMLSE